MTVEEGKEKTMTERGEKEESCKEQGQSGSGRIQIEANQNRFKKIEQKSNGSAFLL